LDHVVIGEGSEWRSIAEVEAATSLGLDFN